MLSTTTFLLSNTFLLSKFFLPSAAHAFNYNIPFIKHIPFIKIFRPLCSPCFQLHSFYQKHSFYHLPRTCHAKQTWGHKVLLGGRVTSAPATQNGNRVTRNFPEASKILHLPHKKKVGSSLSPMICTCHTKRRWNHKKCSEASKNIAPATQRERIGSRRTARRQGRNLPQNGTTGNFSQCHGDLLGGF